MSALHPLPRPANDHAGTIAGLTTRLREIADTLDEEMASVPVPTHCTDRVGLAKAMLVARGKMRAHFATGLFADPARDLLLDLYVAAGSGKRVSISSACIAAAVPATTALRWIHMLRDGGMLRTTPDAKDQRRVFVELTEDAMTRMDAYLDEAALAICPTRA